MMALKESPVITVVLPTYNSAKEISKAIDSIINQTYKNWEILVINDFGSDDGTAEIVKMYAANDKRIKLIQANKRLGLAESLNLGLREAKGKYIARLDADDTSMPERFAKQISFMETHPKVGICGTWQLHYGNGSEWIHSPSSDSKMIRCRLLFWCDLCHSTLMLRRSFFVENDLYYDSSAQAEDYELWTRAMKYMEIANIPEVLGTYNETTGITSDKLQLLQNESGQIVAQTLESILDIKLNISDSRLLCSWKNPITENTKKIDLIRLREILTEIWEKNKKIHFFDNRFLLQTLAAKWFWVKDNVNWQIADYTSVKTIKDVFMDKYHPSVFVRCRMFLKRNPTTSARIKKIIRYLLRPFARFSRKITRALFSDILKELYKIVDNLTWDRYCRTEELLRKSISMMIPYKKEEKIRVVFVFQVASFWPAQEAIYKKLKEDDRFVVVLVCYDINFDNSIKTKTAREYLTQNNYEFIPWEKFSFSDFNPDIVFLQTAYDSNRSGEYTSECLKKNGYRCIYIPYGIEIADTESARHDHFEWPIISNSWKIYTFSDAMRQEYQKYITTRTDVRAFGLPRFDSLFNKKQFPQHETVIQRANTRKVILWKVHFPKIIKEDSKTIMVTPYIEEYIKFAKLIDKNFKDFFFVFMPHPRFREFNKDPKIKQQIQELIETLENKENVYIDEADDYRPSLLNADAIIIDRSAVMIEAAVTNVPVLYMSNTDYSEPITKALLPLVESYEHGYTFEDMIDFVERLRQNQDLNQKIRNDAFHRCIPYFDGKCAERIIEDIFQTYKSENSLYQLLDKQIENWTWERYQRLRHDIESWTWERYQRTRDDYVDQTWNLLYEMKPEKMSEFISQSPTYNFWFYLNNRRGSVESAQRILYRVFQFLPHQNIVDFGCGAGTWLWCAKSFGTKDILGLDGDYVPKGMRMINDEYFMPADLEKVQILPKKYDLAMSLEVAEHLSPDAADNFVESLCGASDTILFSAAHPGQGGNGHINEQPIEYWIDKFRIHDYHPINIKHLFSGDENIKNCYKDNIILFVHRNHYDKIEKMVKDE